MELLEGLKNRKSIRAFKPEAVPKALVTQVLEAARWSPSWGNTQPWEVLVVTGDLVPRLTGDLVAAVAQQVPPNADVPMPTGFPDAQQNRYMACAAGLFGTMGIAREDKAGRGAHMLNMTRAFGAPVIIYLMFNADLQIPYTMLDLGAITHAICLAAHAHGLGTCIEAQLALYPDLVRRQVNVPENRKIVLGIALGYGDPEAPANAFRTEREPLENWVSWRE